MLKKNYLRKLDMGGRGLANRTTQGMHHDNITNAEQAKMRGYEALHEYLHETDTIAIYTGDVFASEVPLFDGEYQNNKDLSGLTHGDLTGYSDNAKKAITAMAKKAAFLAGRAQVKLEDSNMHEI